MDPFDLMRSVWPVLVPTITIIIAYYGLKVKHRETQDAAKSDKIASDLRDERLRGEISGVRHEIGVVRLELRGQISEAIDLKLQRIVDKLDKISDRVVDLETGVAALRGHKA